MKGNIVNINRKRVYTLFINKNICATPDNSLVHTGLNHLEFRMLLQFLEFIIFIINNIRF